MLELLSILAIIVAILAIIPYGIEIWLRFHGKPKLLVTVHSVEVQQDNNTPDADLRFLLNIKLSKGYPIFFHNVQLILPFGAKPYKHPSSSVTFQPSIWMEGTMRTTLVLDIPYYPVNPKLHSVTSKHNLGYLIALVTPTKDHNVDFALFAEMEIDEARLDFWSIFYHARRYRKLLNMKVNLNQSTNQDFTGE